MTRLLITSYFAAESPSGDWYSELAVPILIAAVGSALALLWPAIQAHYRRARFTKLLRRELEEIGPVHPRTPDIPLRQLHVRPKDGDVDHPVATAESSIPWWDYLGRRFVHEQFLRPESMDSEFILSLDPDLVYFVSQLWMAYDSRNLSQWVYYLDELNNYPWSPLILSEEDDLARAVRQWKAIEEDLADQPPSPRSGWRTSDQIPAELITARLSAYAGLLPLTRWPDPTAADRPERFGAIRTWLYEDTNLLLLSGDALAAEQRIEKLLSSAPPVKDDTIKTAMSALRTELKIDLGVRDEAERHIPLRKEDVEDPPGDSCD